MCRLSEIGTLIIRCREFPATLLLFVANFTSIIVNHLDIAPQHASVLMGFSNTFATIPGIVSPIISGYIVITPSVEEWQIVFYITSGIYLFGCAFYGIFASGKLQPWALESQQPERKGTNNNEAHNNAFIPDV